MCGGVVYQPRPPAPHQCSAAWIMAAIIVHGGAYAIPDGIVESSLRGCQLAAKQAHKALEDGKSALDAVELAVCCLEDDPTFNAGHGASLNTAGQIELDAIIMDGKTLNYGSVAGVRNISNPVSLARKVMEKTEHVMLIGQGANEFAREVGVAEVEPEQLLSAEAKRKWADYIKYNKVVSDIFNNPKSSTGNPAPPHTPVKEPFLCDHDTVGAVALDLAGNLAAATSTGGISLKRVGRVGDAPLVGSGAYCDNEIGGVSCTGHGESIAKVVLAHRVLNLLQSLPGCGHDRLLNTAVEAVEQSLQFMLQRTGGRGGLIMITSKGEIAKKCTTQRMAWASVNKNGVLESGIE